MKIQDKDYNCGAYAIYNALRSVGIRASVKKISKIAATTPAGTDQAGMIAALTHFGIKPNVFASTNSKRLFEELTLNQFHLNKETGEEIRLNYPIVACINNYAHWVVILSYLPTYDKFIVLDSNNSKANKAENGIHVVTYDTLIRRWRNKSDGRYYGISF